MLTLNHLSCGYDGQDMIHDIDLSFDPGKLYTVVGKNGCGKSTLLKACAGLLPPSSGTVTLEGRSLKDWSYAERARRLSYLSQTQNRPHITAERLIAHGRFPYLGYPQKLKQTDWDAVNEAISLMHLHDLRHQSLDTLSGGECQRVYLAMQLTQDADVLLLDEPNTYMDIEYQLHFLELLRTLTRQGKTVVMVLHDLEQALHYSDRVIAMDAGRVVRTGTPDELILDNTLPKIFHIQMEHRPYGFHPAD